MSRTFTVDEALDLVWDYMRLDETPESADMMVVGGCSNSSVAEWAAELYHQGLAPRITITGGLTPVARKLWGMSEAKHFAEVMQANGVPTEAIWLEERATHTGENAKFTGELWAEKGVDPISVLAVFKPYMERRAFATFAKWWPERVITVSSPPVSRKQWTASLEIPAHDDASYMVGDLWRVVNYPAKGFQIEQDVPAKVHEALEFLMVHGYFRPVRVGPDTKPV